MPEEFAALENPAHCSPLATKVGQGRPGMRAATRNLSHEFLAVIVDIEEASQLLEAAAAFGFE